MFQAYADENKPRLSLIVWLKLLQRWIDSIASGWRNMSFNNTLLGFSVLINSEAKETRKATMSQFCGHAGI